MYRVLSKFGYLQKVSRTSLWNFFPNSGLRKFLHGTLTYRVCCQLSSTKMDAQCDKLAAVVVIILVTIDVLAAVSASLSHRVSNYMYAREAARRADPPATAGTCTSIVIAAPANVVQRLISGEQQG